jgi:hypothetical protein
MLESGLDQSPAGAVSATRKSVEVLEKRHQANEIDGTL